MASKKTYFTADGNYGTDEVIFIDTQLWTEQMWELMSATTDYDRMELAQHFDLADHDFSAADLVCDFCNLSKEELNA